MIFINDGNMNLCMPDNMPYLFYSLSFLPATEKNIKVSETSKSGKGRTSQPTWASSDPPNLRFCIDSLNRPWARLC